MRCLCGPGGNKGSLHSPTAFPQLAGPRSEPSSLPLPASISSERPR